MDVMLVQQQRDLPLGDRAAVAESTPLRSRVGVEPSDQICRRDFLEHGADRTEGVNQPTPLGWAVAL